MPFIFNPFIGNFDYYQPSATVIPVLDNVLLTEAGEYLITEAGENILWE